MDIEIDIERIAREKIIAEVMASHLDDRPDHTNYLNWAVGIAHEVANTIAAHEREECAKVCDSYSGRYEEEMGALGCANAIRSRGTKE